MPQKSPGRRDRFELPWMLESRAEPARTASNCKMEVVVVVNVVVDVAVVVVVVVVVVVGWL